MSSYFVTKDEEKNVRWRIPFTVYFLWKDPAYGQWRLVVKEITYNFDESIKYGYRII